MKIRQKQDFLINLAFWLCIAAAVYLVLQYILPISVPFILGILAAQLVVWLSRKIRCTHKVLRIVLAVVLYGIVGTLIAVLAVQLVSGISSAVQLLPQVYETKLLPFATLCYDWCVALVRQLDPAWVNALESLLGSILSSLQSVVTYLSGLAVSLVSTLVTGIPSLVLSLLAMIFSTIFVVSDHENISAFARRHTPAAVKHILGKIKHYLTDTLFVVIRSYALIMLLTFTELSILFAVFGIKNAILKAAIIAMLDILPILGTGGIMIPWAVISFTLGNASLGIRLLIIYAIVTVIRNYVEPKIVGTQLGLHPIITLVAMFLGLRLFGFWGLFGLPVGISFLWKERHELLSRRKATQVETAESAAQETEPVTQEPEP